mmetsp:Transcript_28315/g.74704  ORF Transcript_28315/g.74704 Transcript_28315/m.74704 type:complete len:219 (+) Transcript_28315:78-734(+)
MGTCVILGASQTATLLAPTESPRKTPLALPSTPVQRGPHPEQYLRLSRQRAEAPRRAPRGAPMCPIPPRGAGVGVAGAARTASAARGQRVRSWSGGRPKAEAEAGSGGVHRAEAQVSAGTQRGSRRNLHRNVKNVSVAMCRMSVTIVMGEVSQVRRQPIGTRQMQLVTSNLVLELRVSWRLGHRTVSPMRSRLTQDRISRSPRDQTGISVRPMCLPIT